MRHYTRRQLLGAAALASGALGSGAIYGVWQTFGGHAPPRRDPAADLTPWQDLDAGRPILVALPRASDATFAGYLGDVLLTEGINAFSLASLETAIRHGLERFPVVLLAAGQLSPSHVEAIRAYVEHGGRLVAMQASDALAHGLGLEPLGADSVDADLQISSTDAWTTDLTPRPLRLHARARLWRARDWDVLATLATRTDGASRPAVVRRPAGAVVFWSFDVAEAVVLARQGNPALAGVSEDLRRTADLFDGWVDPSALDVPHADEHARLLVRVLTRLLDDVCPLPRLWYFPGNARAMLVATGDSHQSPAPAIESALRRVEAFGGTMSIYYTPPIAPTYRRVFRNARSWARDVPVAHRLSSVREVIPRPSDVRRWRSRGHAFGLHPWTDQTWESGWDAACRSFEGLQYGPVPPTTRTHQVAWTGWAAQAAIQAECGVRMNCDYYHFGDAVRNHDGSWGHGFLTGSGLPARFADDAGRVLDIFQQCTQLVDEHLMESPWGGNGPRLSPDAAAAISRDVLTLAASAHTPAAICAQFHVDLFAMGGEWLDRFGAWMDSTLSTAAGLGLPIVSAENWLASLDARFETTLDQCHWDADRHRFSLRVSVPTDASAAPTLVLPACFAGRDLAGVTLDGEDVDFARATAHGDRAVRVALHPGCRTVEAHFR